MKNRSSPRRSRYAVTLLLILISMFTVTSLYYNQTPYNPLDLLPRVNAAPTIALNPTSGFVGSFVSISGTGFSVSDLTCTLSGAVVSSPGTCTISGGTMSDSFLVAAVSPGTYVVQIQGSTGDSATAGFTVNGPTIALNPTSGPAGITVTVTGIGFSTGDVGACTITPGAVATSPACSVTASGSLSGTSFVVGNVATGTYAIAVQGLTGDSASASFILTIASPSIALSSTSGSPGITVTVTGSGFAPADAGACTITPGTVATAPACTVTASGTLTGTHFVVGNVAAGTYTITVHGSTGDFASAAFTVIGPAITLNPTSGPVGTSVSIAGSGFAISDAGACTITPAAVATASACTVAGSGSLTGTLFTVGNVPAGTYVITVTGLSGDFAQTTFTVVGPSITLTPNSGPAGTIVTVNGNNFAPGDAGACTIGPGTVATASVCTVTGSGTLTASHFAVGNVAAGMYVITVTGLTGDFGQASFTISTASPTITLTPNSGSVGASVTVTGSGFAPADAGACTITPGTVATAPACTVTASGTLTGTHFVVGNVAAGTYTITVQGSTGDPAQAIFTVIGPSIVLHPTSGLIGTVVSVTGSGFSTADVGACFITPAGVATASACTVTAAGALSSTSFTVGSVAGGTYVITVTGSTGDFAQATFTVIGPTITLNPTLGVAGITVTITGSNFAPGDAGACTITPGAVATSPACTVTASGTLSVGHFAVGNVPLASYTITVTGITGDFATATFTVTSSTPIIALGPASGPVSTVVTVTGSGFAVGDAGSCAPVTSTPAPDIVTLSSCTISASGQVTASFTVSSTAALGAHTIKVTGSTSDSAQATFTVTTTTPTITLNPSSGLVSTVVTVTGSGFNHADAGSCAPVTSTPAPDIVTLSSCTISASGQVTASFTVSSTAALGAHTIKVTGSTSDSAQATFTVISSTPTITLNPVSGSVLTVVSVTGSGFNPADVGACLFTSNPSGLIAVLPVPVCTISSSGQLTGSFTVANTALTQSYTVRATGSTTDFAQATFTVTTPTPAIFLNPSSGPVGTVVTVLGGGFNPTDVSCAITSNPGTLFTVSSCTTVTSSGQLNGVSFTVANTAAPGTYSVKVTGTGTSDFASTVFIVTTLTPRITISPGAGPTSTSVSLTASGFSSSDTLITFTSSPSGLFTGVITCVPSGGACTKTTTVTSVTSQSYTVIGTGDVAADSASTVFVLGTNVLTLSPSSGPSGTLVSFSGVIPSGKDTSCSVGAGSGSGISTSTASCVIVSTASGTTSVAGAFVVSSLSPGTYSVRVSGIADTGNTGTPNYVEATFILTGPQIILNPASGRSGITVSISGSGFSFADNTCSLSGQTNGAIILNGACSIGGGSGIATGSFTVGQVSPGTYVIRVTGAQGGSDFAEATFTVTTGASVVLHPTSGGVGLTVTVTGSGFRSDDSSCSISGTSVLNPGCSIIVGSGTPTGSFQVANVAPGTYVITLSGSQGDSAQATFTVTTGASVLLTPSSGGVGITVTVTGSGFRTDDSSCTISGTGVQNAACIVSLGTGTPLGSFVVANVAPGAYVITLSGNNGDSAQAFFTVVSGASVRLLPISGGAGQIVTVTGSGFRTDDSSCSISGSNGIVTGSACSVTLGTGAPSGSFVVANVAPGAYTITLSGNQGDSAQTTFTVTTGPAIVLSPSTGAVGVTVTVTGAGFQPADTSCSLSGSVVTGSSCIITAGSGSPTGIFTVGGVGAGSYTVTLQGSSGDSAQALLVVTVTTPVLTLYPSSSVAPGTTVTFTATGLLAPDSGCTLQALPSTIILSSPTCTIGGAHVATGSFVVSASATADKNPWTIEVVGSPGNDIISATLTVIPEITVTPASGTIGTQFSFTGEGFSSAAVSCTVTITPGTWTSQSCGVSSNGQVSGSFIANTNSPGNYAVTVADNAGFSAGSFAVIGAPTAQLTISPNVVSPGQVVQISGSGFNTGDTSCTITPASIISSATCSISGGVVSATFTASTTISGLYLMTVTGNGGDFASNYLEVAIITGTITTSTSTTTSVTTTTASSVTTSIPITLTTTTFTFTGPSTSTIYTLTTTSITGQSTYSVSTVTTTTNTITSITSTTTSQTVTGIYTLGGMIGKSLSSSQGISGNMVGLISVLTLLGLVLVRRWAF